MNGDAAGLKAICDTLNKNLQVSRNWPQVGLCAPLVFLAQASQWNTTAAVITGAQTCHWEKKGAFTGEVSVPMLKAVGVQLCLAGHSERRQLFGETDEVVQKKLAAILQGGLWGVLCLGETLRERETNQHLEIVERQLGVLEGLQSYSQQLLVAYEPVWAIGTGVNATPEQASEMHAYIHQWLVQQWGKIAENIPILYGGSVKGDNAVSLFTQPHVDGALVGGASLTWEAFWPIIQAASAA